MFLKNNGGEYSRPLPCFNFLLFKSRDSVDVYPLWEKCYLIFLHGPCFVGINKEQTFCC